MYRSGRFDASPQRRFHRFHQRLATNAAPLADLLLVAARAAARAGDGMKRKTVLLTGAAGGVGGRLRREPAGRDSLRLSDSRPGRDLPRDGRFTRANLARSADCARIAKGVDAIVHLGGYAVEGPWAAILEANIVGCYNVFEAARRHGVKRVVFAS